MIKSLVLQNRSYRRYQEAERIAPETLLGWIDTARLVSNGQNKQVLRYHPITDEAICATVFAELKWAAKLPDWKGPEPGERPAAYIVICHDTRLSAKADMDVGIAADTLRLAAIEQGIGSCMLGAFHRVHIHTICQLPAWAEEDLVVSFGVPGETVEIVDLPDGVEDTDYYRDGACHMVPKRSLQDVIL